MTFKYTVTFDNRVAGVLITRNTDGATVWLQGDDAAELENDICNGKRDVQDICADYDDVMTLERDRD